MSAAWEHYPYGLPPASCDCEHGDRPDGSGAGGPKSADADCELGLCTTCHDDCPEEGCTTNQCGNCGDRGDDVAVRWCGLRPQWCTTCHAENCHDEECWMPDSVHDGRDR